MDTPEPDYPLLPIQGGMLYQHLLAAETPERGGYDIEQICIATDEDLRADVLQQAWTDTVNRHPVLRTTFHWEERLRPVQRPETTATVPLEQLDWSQGDVAAHRSAFLSADRLRGFDLRKAPLVRLTLVRLPQGRQELYFTFHHLLMDGRSFADVRHEAFSRYEARLAALSHEAGQQYFAGLLAGKQAATPLPLAEPATRPLEVCGFDTISYVLDEGLRIGWQRYAETMGVSMANVLQAAWTVLLARLTGDHDVVFGVTRSCRYQGHDAIHVDTVGLFINTLPVRFALDEQERIDTFLHRIRQSWLEQRGHAHTPLADVISRSDVPAGNPLFESQIVFDNRELNQQLRRRDPAWARRVCSLHEQPAFPLTLTVDDGDQLELHLLYDRRRFAESNMVRLRRYLACVLEAMLTARHVADVQVLPADEYQQMVHGWNETARPFEDDLLIHQLFERQVEQRPSAIAVVVNGVETRFDELERRANRLANALRMRGIGPGHFVGFCLQRGLELVVAMLGIAKSGAAYVPIDPEHPPERIAFMLQDTQASLLLVDSGDGAAVAAHSVPLMAMDDECIDNAPDTRPAATGQATDVCYVIYTSGSTGKPKGVVMAHRAVVNTLEWVSREFGVGPGDRALFVTSPCFDLSVYDVFGVLGAGGTVVVATGALLREPADLVAVLTQQRITLWDSAPAALQRLVPLFPGNGGTHLRLVMLSGDWIPLTLPDAVRSAFPAAQIKSLGGATEAAIWSNWYPVGAIDPTWNSIPYGRPIQNAQYHVLDARRQPMPAGVPGDLYIAGTCLAQGYLNRPELTAERFVDNPFRPGERMYMTGDLARYFGDGVIEFLGRADFQVKIRGFRVELGEVEAALLAIPEVRDAVCTAFTDVSGAKALVAYLTAKAGCVIDQETIKELLRCSLPEFMVPSRMIVLDAMPLSANGKVDRKALPEPVANAATEEAGVVSGEAQLKMAAVWSRLLKTDKLGPQSHFLNSGGDSLLAVSLALEIEQEFGKPFPLACIMESPTLAGMAALVGDSGPAQAQHLVTLNANVAGRAPLFLFSGGGGFGFFYHDLASKAGPDQPMHVFNAIGADSEMESLPLSIEEMAAIYEPEIVAMCPAGPLAIGGYSFGSLLAYELSKRLMAHGREVSLLISFDGPAPGYPRKLALLPRLVEHLRKLCTLGAHQRRAYLRDRWVNLKQRLEPMEDHPLLAPPPGMNEVMAQRLRKLSANLAMARNLYHPVGQVACPVLLLRAEQPVAWPGHVLPDDYGWTDFSETPVSIEVVPGSHLKLFNEENNRTMAQVIKQRLVPGGMR